LRPATLYVGQAAHVVAVAVGQQDVLKVLGVNSEFRAIAKDRVARRGI